MGAHPSTPVQVDPHAVQHAQKSWHNFTLAIRIGVALIIVLLLGMAFFLV